MNAKSKPIEPDVCFACGSVVYAVCVGERDGERERERREIERGRGGRKIKRVREQKRQDTCWAVTCFHLLTAG